jgi:hypothetical protein
MSRSNPLIKMLREQIRTLGALFQENRKEGIMERAKLKRENASNRRT